MLEPLLNDCGNLTRIDLHCTVSHVYRKTNRRVNSLAKMGAMQRTDFLFLNDLSPMAESVLPFAKAEHFCNRMVISSSYYVSV